MRELRVAVIIPCFNDGELAVTAIRSIDEREPVEVVVIDDGSTDPASKAALTAEEQRGTRVIWQENTGLCGARMRGVAETEAKYVFPLDSDDLMLPGSLASLADTLDAHDDAGFAFGDVEYFGDDEFVAPAPEFDPWLTLYGNFWSPSIMLRRTVIDATGGWSLDDYYEDWDLMMTLAQDGYTGVHCGRTTFRHRNHGFRMLNRARLRHAELYERLVERHRDLFQRKRELARTSPNASRWARLTFPVRYGSARRFVPASIETRAFAIKRALRG